MTKVRKTEPAVGYQPEEGCYLRGNDYSPAAVVVIFRWRREQTPPEIEELVRVSAESGAALAGTLQMENIGIEKIICNVVSNPNIRYLIVCGPESPGHLVGETLLALSKKGLDEQKRIIGTEAPTPYLFNVQPEFVERFRNQVTLIDLVNEGSPEILREAVWSCHQEKPTVFKDYELCDPGAYPAEPLSGKITWRITEPSSTPKSNEERAHQEKILSLIERIRKSNQRDGHPDIGKSKAGENAHIQEQDR